MAGFEGKQQASLAAAGVEQMVTTNVLENGAMRVVRESDTAYNRLAPDPTVAPRPRSSSYHASNSAN